jgi:tetratricopeptide (TPR) repeat protein
MRTDLAPDRSSRIPQAEITADRTQQLNAAETRNSSATPSATHVMESDRLDTRHQSVLIGENTGDQLQAWLKEAQRRQDDDSYIHIKQSQENTSTLQPVKHYPNFEIPTRKPVKGQNLTHRPIQENTSVKLNALIESNASNASATEPLVRKEELPTHSNFDSSLTVPQPTPEAPPPQRPPMPLSQLLPLPSSQHSLDSASVSTKETPIASSLLQWAQTRLRDGRCKEYAINTVFCVFGIPPITLDKEITVDELIDRARKKGLHSELHCVEDYGENRITGIENAKAFIIIKPSLLFGYPLKDSSIIIPNFFHAVAVVSPDETIKEFHEWDSDDQDKSQSKKYSGNTAQDALFDYETKNNVTACAVLTFREIVSADGPKLMFSKGCALFDRSLWEKAIEALDEVITCLCKEKEPKQPVLLAGALHNRGLALYKSGFWKEAIEDYKEVIMRFGKADDPALRKIVEKASHNRKVALSKLSDHGDGEQTGA